MWRDKVLELCARGLTQQEIASKMNCSQKTISNDIVFLKGDADGISNKTERT